MPHPHSSPHSKPDGRTNYYRNKQEPHKNPTNLNNTHSPPHTPPPHTHTNFHFCITKDHLRKNCYLVRGRESSATPDGRGSTYLPTTWRTSSSSAASPPPLTWQATSSSYKNTERLHNLAKKLRILILASLAFPYYGFNTHLCTITLTVNLIWLCLKVFIASVNDPLRLAYRLTGTYDIELYSLNTEPLPPTKSRHTHPTHWSYYLCEVVGCLTLQFRLPPEPQDKPADTERESMTSAMYYSSINHACCMCY